MGIRGYRRDPTNRTVSWPYEEIAAPGRCPECAGAGVVLDDIDEERLPVTVRCERCKGAGRTNVTQHEQIEAKLAEAHALLAKVDNRAREIALYVGDHEDPVEALKKIRNYVQGFVIVEGPLALAVVCLDRVIGQLGDFRLRLVYYGGAR